MAFSKLAALLALAVGARAADDQVVVGQTFMAGAIDPTSGSTGWALTSHGISEKLFTVDKDGEIVGQVAESVERVSDNVWEVTLKDGYKFSDGTDVTAQAVADALTELNTVDPNGAGMASVGTMTVTAPSDGVVRIETERATHVMDAVLAEWVFTVYKKDGDDLCGNQISGPRRRNLTHWLISTQAMTTSSRGPTPSTPSSAVATSTSCRTCTTSTARRTSARTSSSCSTPTASR